ncbi:hypothetical protein QBC33DRAFT_564365 [Phialemonium atrogriseum]|uniref:Uncharacterized protein n=1 Tax=Phialemonium atrogriseum TaxID=1093897 RepID=A0AAJ0FAX0_9PEZI|nr:uncharacterized protein QBC33DRAFT_564365 [Phialemonium atrogriseum]KAK1761846.1 hypothetical protein QBC33DRAFT_564365 [Phialemonium atrogriseum]
MKFTSLVLALLVGTGIAIPLRAAIDVAPRQLENKGATAAEGTPAEGLTVDQLAQDEWSAGTWWKERKERK